MKRCVVTLICIAPMASSLAANASPDSQRAASCAPLAGAVASQAAGSQAAFVRSYEHGEDESRLPAGLASTAFVYDNALAAIALVACGDVTSATTIANALSRAAHSDRSFPDGRVRNAYRPGPVGDGAPALPGWWDDKQKIWAEDPAQDGTSTGNVAWAALALLTLHQATKQQSFLVDARHLIDWVIANLSSGNGFRGGFHGYDPQQVPLTWISTEHNVDVYAAATWLFRLTDQRK